MPVIPLARKVCARLHVSGLRMIGPLLLALLIGLVGLIGPVGLSGLAPATAAGDDNTRPVLSAARTGIHGADSRLVLEFDRAPVWNVFLLPDPNRAVIDLPEIDWRGPEPNRLPAKGLFAGFRYGLFRPGVSRVVIDLNGPARIASVFTLPGKGGSDAVRLVLDLAPATGNGNADVAPVSAPGWAAYAREAELRAAGLVSAGAAKAANPSARRTVVIDPGHGGVDPGAIGRSGSYEKHIVLDFSRALKAELERLGAYHVVLTRDRDMFLPLRARFEKAHAAEADLFLSVHADSHANGRIAGATVYTLSDTASDKEAAALARQENKADLIAGADLTGYASEVSSILIDLAQQSVNESSWHMAEMLVGDMKQSVRMNRNPHRYAGFAVLKSPNVPSVLIELGYLSNRQDEKDLKNAAYRQKIAGAIGRAVDSYFRRLDRLSRS